MMEEDEDNELDLNIPVKSLLEDISCPVCLNFIEDCSTLPCGHNFCHKCVAECINRNHKCPLCNKATVKENIFKNHQFDKIIKIIRFEKEKSKTIYYDKLTSSIEENSNRGGGGGGELQRTTSTTSTANSTTIDPSSPIETLFKKYLKGSLISFESYYQDLSRPYNENIKRLKKATQETIDKLIAANGASNGMNDILVDQIKRECQIKQDKLAADFKISTDYLLSSLEDYLKKTAVPPSFINIYTSISIPERDLVFDHCSFKPSSSLADIRSTLVDKLNNRGEKYHFISFTDESHFIVLKPTSMVDNASAEDSTILLNDELKPLYFYNIPQGSRIILKGGVQLKGDIPKECFKRLFVAGTDQTMDYYRCEDCKVNWICKNCSDFCHKGHNIVSYILNHKPTYGCCYDEKHNRCKLISK